MMKSNRRSNGATKTSMTRFLSTFAAAVLTLTDDCHAFSVLSHASTISPSPSSSSAFAASSRNANFNANAYGSIANHLQVASVPIDHLSASTSAEDILSGRFYQLEQLEEDHSILTEVFLRGDGTVEVGSTDGPKFQAANGIWYTQSGDAKDSFAMSMTQEFQGGMEHASRLRIGTFPFQVERVFVGERTMVGEKLAISGKIFCGGDEMTDTTSPIGYFHLIDTTEERLGEDRA